MLLEVAGRKTGAIRTTPLVYVVDDGDYIVAAAYSGADSNPAWWENLRAAGKGTVQVGTARAVVSAAEAEGEDRDRLWEKLCQMYPPFLDYVTRTDRQFPIVRMTPAGNPP
jgi:deazaflavin-dependent oxidoreductase (nitroreductase family)